MQGKMWYFIKGMYNLYCVTEWGEVGGVLRYLPSDVGKLEGCCLQVTSWGVVHPGNSCIGLYICSLIGSRD